MSGFRNCGDHSLAGSPAETQVQRDLLTTQQSDILQQQSNHPFAFAVGGVHLAPQPRKVGRQLKDRRNGVLAGLPRERKGVSAVQYTYM